MPKKSIYFNIKDFYYQYSLDETLIEKYLEPSMMLILDGIINVNKYKMSEKTIKNSSEIIKAICNNNNAIKQKVEV
jgi:hypothetical protein